MACTQNAKWFIKSKCDMFTWCDLHNGESGWIAYKGVHHVKVYSSLTTARRKAKEVGGIVVFWGKGIIPHIRQK